MAVRTMNRRWIVLAITLAAVGIGTVVVPGVARAQDRGEDEMALKGNWAEGFWPTKKMMENFIRRSTMEIEERYGLREDQRDYLEASSVERWPAFFEENRARLQPLITQYLEMQTSAEPPSPEQMQKWSEGAQDMLGAFKEEIHEQQMDFREILDPQQKMTFDSEMMKFNVGMQAAETKLKDWQSGNFNPRDIGWKPATNKQREELANAPQVKPPDEINPENAEENFVPRDGWDSWLDAFAAKYDIDDAQLRQANRIVTDLKKRASMHYSRNHREYDRLDRVPPDSRDADWQERMQKLDEPLLGLFDELVEKCFALLTPDQRERGRAPAAPTGSTD